MLLPFLMVLFAIPRSPKGRPNMYEWEYKRKDRPQLRAAMIRRDQMIRKLKLAVANGQLQRTSNGLTAGGTGRSTTDDRRTGSHPEDAPVGALGSGGESLPIDPSP